MMMPFQCAMRISPKPIRHHAAVTITFRRLLGSASSSSSDSKKKNDDDNDQRPSVSSSSSRPLLEHTSTGIGQVIFLNSPKCGAILLGSLAIGDPFVALLGGVGAVSSTAFANAVCDEKNNKATSTANGLLAYNGCLVGCATAVFIAPFPTETSSIMLQASSLATALSVTAAGSSTATMLTLSLREQLFTTMPQWTVAFNLVTLTMLLRIQPFLPTHTITDEEGTVSTAIATTPSTTSTLDMILLAPWKGLSQIFVVESTLSGIGIASAIALYSPGLAGHAIMGSTLGALTGWLVYGASPAEVAMGLWGFNSALTSLGAGVFFVHSPATVVLSASGAIVTASVFAALQTVFGYVYSPCLTLPFCLTMSACYGLVANQSVKGLVLAADPHSPERNET